MYKQDLGLNNQQRLNAVKLDQTKPFLSHNYLQKIIILLI